MSFAAYAKIAAVLLGLLGAGGVVWHYHSLGGKLDDCRAKVSEFERRDAQGRGAVKVVAKAGVARRRAIQGQTLTADEVNAWYAKPPY